jgi:hypothetical protein
MDVSMGETKRQMKTIAELEKIVLAAVRKVPHCEGIAAVRVNARPQEPGWWPDNVRLGDAHAADCQRGINEIMPKLGRLYGLKKG